MSGLYCDVLVPPDAQGGYGELIGNDGTYLRSVPIKYEQLSGREGEVARATFGASTVRITISGNPRRPLDKSMRLRVKGGIKELILEIVDIKDTHQNGQQYELLCGEADG